MKKYTAILSQLLVIGLVILNGFAARESAAQYKGSDQLGVIEEVRPFDFSDQFYKTNGVDPSMIIDRRNGADKLSVIDFVNDRRYRNVRITGTFPAYDRDGNILYWNHYGDLYDESFVQEPTGKEAISIANRYPIFTFPSETVKHSDRQAVLIEVDDAYFEKNVLGLGVFIAVEFTEQYQNKRRSDNSRSIS